MANNQDNTTTSDRRYNGWTNYETWAVGLWIDNDQATYVYWREEATRHVRQAAEDEMVKRGVWTVQASAGNALAQQLKDELTEAVPDLGSSVYSDLLGAALDEVNWTELAESLLSDIES